MPLAFDSPNDDRMPCTGDPSIIMLLASGAVTATGVILTCHLEKMVAILDFHWLQFVERLDAHTTKAPLGLPSSDFRVPTS